MPTSAQGLNSPRSILITGASSGLGEALALHYAAPGVTLFLSGRNETRLKEVEKSCLEKGARVHSRVMDVRDADSMQEWITSSDLIGPLDLVIANAGISGGTADGLEPDQQVRDIFDINLTGVLNTIQPALKKMLARGSGQIALMASLASFSPWPGAPAYGASKGAVRLYGEALRSALARTGVNVSVICPGFVESRMTSVNDYSMPFLMDAPKAARIMAKGLARNQGRIAFPWQTYAIAGTLACLPPALLQIILKNAPGKKPISVD